MDRSSTCYELLYHYWTDYIWTILKDVLDRMYIRWYYIYMDTKDNTLILRIDAETKDKLRELAYEMDVTMSEAVRQLIVDAWAQAATQTKQEA